MTIWSELYTTGESIIRPLDVPDYLPRSLNTLEITLNSYFKNGELLFLLADNLRKSKNESIIRLPLDHHLEYRSFGAQVKADFDLGSRLKTNYLTTLNSVEDALNHPIFLAVLEAISIAKKSGHKVLLNVSGIYTIISGLKGVSYLARYNKEEFKEICHSIENYLLSYIKLLLTLNVDLIHFGDPLINPLLTGWTVYEDQYRTYISLYKHIVDELSQYSSCFCLHPALGYLAQEREAFIKHIYYRQSKSLIEDMLMYKNKFVTVDLHGHILSLEKGAVGY